MRCIALAQAWKTRGGEVTFITNCEINRLRQRIANEGFDIIALDTHHPDPKDLNTTLHALKSTERKSKRDEKAAGFCGPSTIPPSQAKSWVVLDGYHFDSDYQQQIGAAGYPLLVIDDMAHLDHYYADVVLNQNAHADKSSYFSEPNTKLLMGTDYILLRSEFLKWRKWQRDIPKAGRKILVTLGGSDPDNITLRLIQALEMISIKGMEAVVVVGASNPRHDEIAEAAARATASIRVRENPENMAELMAWADVAVSAGGTTSWELAFMGVPSCVLILAENQRRIAETLQKDGIAVSLGEFSACSPEMISGALFEIVNQHAVRGEMSRRGRELVDGSGGDRVATELIRGR
jgi:UDP-2,4-diacetamido-2,4,6-trideoxy-beta-L-altropyranose hydrolase